MVDGVPPVALVPYQFKVAPGNAVAIKGDATLPRHKYKGDVAMGAATDPAGVNVTVTG